MASPTFNSKLHVRRRCVANRDRPKSLGRSPPPPRSFSATLYPDSHMVNPPNWNTITHRSSAQSLKLFPVADPRVKRGAPIRSPFLASSLITREIGGQIKSTDSPRLPERDRLSLQGLPNFDRFPSSRSSFYFSFSAEHKSRLISGQNLAFADIIVV